jgi:hypothetical protein
MQFPCLCRKSARLAQIQLVSPAWSIKRKTSPIDAIHMKGESKSSPRTTVMSILVEICYIIGGLSFREFARPAEALRRGEGCSRETHLFCIVHFIVSES